MEMTGGPMGKEGESRESRDSLNAAAVPLVTVTRNGVSDLEHFGFACLVNSDGNRVWSVGDAHKSAFFRSCAKPLQALAVVTSGAADAAGLSEQDLAIICGSHTGGSDQVTQVKSLLEKSKIPADALGCGDGLADMCSGKHAGMLTACKHLHLPLHNYLEPDHPWQQRVLKLICEFCATGPENTTSAVDGCSAPTFSLPVYNMALGFARLGKEATNPGPASRVLTAMANHPGDHTGEPDLRGFSLTPPQTSKLPAIFFSKGGANGLHCAAIPELGLGFALKVIDGAALPRWPVFTKALEQTGIISSATALAMRSALWPQILTRKGIVAGELRMEF